MDSYDAKSIKELLEIHGIKPSRMKGQNFLIDANIPEKIVRLSGLNESCGVIEVGPGLGALTAALSRTAGYVTAVEIDGQLIPVLSDLFRERKNVCLVRGDILKIDLRELANEKMPGLTYHICANLPYNITSPAITGFIQAEIFKTITVMVQREVARRICAEPKTPEYGAFTVYTNYHTKPQILFDVPPECFMPRPKICSSVLKMETRTERLADAADEEVFFRVVRAAFSQRRKTLVNALFSVFGNSYDKQEIIGILESCGLTSLVRGETLDIEKFIDIAAHFKQ